MPIAAFAQYFFGISIFVSSMFLVMLVLVQRGRGGGLTGALGGAGGQSAFGTKAGDLFTRITIGVAVVWILLCAMSVFFLKDRGLPSFGITGGSATNNSSTIGGSASGDSETGGDAATGLGGAGLGDGTAVPALTPPAEGSGLQLPDMEAPAAANDGTVEAEITDLPAEGDANSDVQPDTEADSDAASDETPN